MAAPSICRKDATALAAEIASPPSKLSAAIAEMGMAHVSALSGMFRGLIAKFSQYTKTSFEGGNDLGGLIQKASFDSDSGADDNFRAAPRVVRF
ncbi:hypothetical protein SAMN02799625_05532 [Methylobacterium sp. UNC300MFChir4.1]|nr:hypothetical protein SAMN02799625_05532 [Methylobacterium sp. UNC300MFChir4.1]